MARKILFLVPVFFILVISTGCSTLNFLNPKWLDECKKRENDKYTAKEIGDVCPVNPHASPEAGAVLIYLAEISKGNIPGFIIGQNCGHGNEIARPEHFMSYQRLVENLHAKTGKYVGMLGVDYGFNNNMAIVDNANVKEFMNDPYVITRDKITWRNYLQQ